VCLSAGVHLLLGADFSGYTAGEKLPEEWQKTLAGVDKVRAALEDAGMLPEIGYIEIGEEQSYKAVYQDRIQLRLGSEYDLATKLLTAQKIIQDELPADFIGYLDVSVSGRAYTRQLPLTQRMHNIWPFWVENSSRYTPFGLHFHDVSVMID